MTSIPTEPPVIPESENTLFPVFLKLETLSVLLVGGGNVALEKLQALLNNAPRTRIRIVAISVDERIRELAARFPAVSIDEKAYSAADLTGMDLLVVAVNDIPLSEAIRSP